VYGIDGEEVQVNRLQGWHKSKKKTHKWHRAYFAQLTVEVVLDLFFLLNKKIKKYENILFLCQLFFCANILQTNPLFF
jgi:hypothetical protein